MLPGTGGPGTVPALPDDKVAHHGSGMGAHLRKRESDHKAVTFFSYWAARVGWGIAQQSRRYTDSLERERQEKER